MLEEFGGYGRVEDDGGEGRDGGRLRLPLLLLSLLWKSIPDKYTQIWASNCLVEKLLILYYNSTSHCRMQIATNDQRNQRRDERAEQAVDQRNQRRDPRAEQAVDQPSDEPEEPESKASEEASDDEEVDQSSEEPIDKIEEPTSKESPTEEHKELWDEPSEPSGDDEPS